MTAYATRKDVYELGGLPRGSVSGAARLVASSLALTDVITLSDHGFETGDEVLLRTAAGGTLSAPLVAGTAYYAIRLTDSTFKLAATSSGSAIDLTTDGVNMSVSIALPFDRVLLFYSRFVDAFMPAHVVPFLAGFVPITVVAIVAELSAKKLQLLSGQTSIVMSETELAAKAQLERWAKGIPLRDANATASANRAVSSAMGATTDPRGWGSGSLP